MKDVLILATSRYLVNKVEKLIKEEGLTRISIVFFNEVKEMLKFAEEKLPETTEVLLTLPGPSVLLESIIPNKIPVLPIEYNNIDIVKALQNALSLCPGSVALAHYKEENPRLKDIQEIVALPFMNLLFGDNDTVNRKILQKFKEQGISAIVGGGYICNLAQETGFSIFPLEVHDSTLRKTIKRALSIADTRKFTRYSKQKTNTILQYQTEAVIIVDNKNRIIFFNKNAEKIFNLTSELLLGKNSADVLQKNCFETVMANKEPIENHIHSFNSMDIISDYRPVLDNGNLIGAIASFIPVANILKKEQTVREYYTPKNSDPRFSFKNFQGNTPRFNALLEKAKCFANTDETILITGESGTGKEVMASSIYHASRRRFKPFFAINCASIPESLMESELFGYEAGAFTGGKKSGSAGLFESAHGGTLFLDEIGELPFELQSKLLRVIQERKVRRIGSSKERPVDVRIIAATNKILEQEVAANRFRVDLYYRLNILQIHMLPLREYAENIGDIAIKILLEIAPETALQEQQHLRELLKKLNNYNWPGNVRELENIVRRYVALSPYLKRKITLGDIFTRPFIQEGETNKNHSLNDQEFFKIQEVFNKLHGNRSLTARELGISRSTLWRKLKQYNLR